RIVRLDDKAQTFLAFHTDFAPLRDRAALTARGPFLARYIRDSIRSDVALPDARRTHEDRRAARPRELARREREPRDKEEEQARHQRDGGDHDRIDVSAESRERRSQRWEQDDRPHDERDETARGEQEVARDLDLGDEEHDRENKESDPRCVRIEGTKSEQRENDGDHSDDAGEDEARIAELEDDPVGADRE